MTDLDNELGAAPLTDLDKELGAKPLSNVSKSSAEDPGMLEAVRAGFANGGTLGFAPRIGAGVGALASAAQQQLSGEPQPQSLKDLYNEYLDYNNKLQEKAHDAHPYIYNGATLLGGIASPLNKIAGLGLGSETAQAINAADKLKKAGQAVQTASMPLRMINSGIQGAKIGAVAGLANSKDLTDAPQDLSEASKGMALGGAIGTAAPPVIAGLQSAASVTGGGLRSFFGDVGGNFSKGVEAGSEGGPKLSTPEGQASAAQDRSDFANKFVDDLRNIVKTNAKNKVEKIQGHLDNLPQEQIDPVLNKILEMDPKEMGTKEAEEFEQIKEEILRAKEGPMVNETVRQYNPGQAPEPISGPGAQYRPPIEGSEVLPPEGEQVQGEAPEAAEPEQPAQLEASQQPDDEVPPPPAEESAPESKEGTNNFQGYEAVHKATITAGDQEAEQAFQQKIHEKLADEEALGKNFNDNPIQIEKKPIPGTDKVRLVAKRAIQDEDSQAFKEQAKALSDKQKQEAQAASVQQREDQRLQALLDKQQEEALKQKAQQESEMIKPQFQDIQQQVRAGNRNITDPKQLYALQQIMQEYGSGVAPRMTTRAMQNVAKGASQDLSQVLKQNVGTSDVDQVLHAFNNIGEVLNIDPRDLQLPGGAGEQSREKALDQVLKIINPKNFSDSDLVNNEKIKYIADQLENISPDLSKQFTENVEKQSQTKGLVKEFTQPYEPTGINLLTNLVRKNAAKMSYNTGYNIGEQGRKLSTEVGPAIQAGQKIFSQYSPQSLNDMASKALNSGDQTLQQFGQVLSKLATADERTRSSMIFVMEQQAGYKAMMDKLMGPQEQGSTQAKDKNLQKFK